MGRTNQDEIYLNAFNAAVAQHNGRLFYTGYFITKYNGYFIVWLRLKML